MIELKYPRDSRTGISPDTMTLGELLRDFLRVAAVPAAGRWVVQLLNDRVVRYLESAYRRNGLVWASTPGQPLTLPAAGLAGLPATAARAIGAAAVTGAVTGTCHVVEPVGPQLMLYAYRVEGLTADGASDANPFTTASPTMSLRAPTRDGARREILDAARAVITRSTQQDFSMPEVIAEMHRRGTGYAESTIRTMISSHLCADATGEGVAGYADLTRAGRGLYRFTVSDTRRLIQNAEDNG